MKKFLFLKISVKANLLILISAIVSLFVLRWSNQNLYYNKYCLTGNKCGGIESGFQKIFQ